MCYVAPVAVCHQNTPNIISWCPSESPLWLPMPIGISLRGFSWCCGHCCNGRCCHGSLWWFFRMWWYAPEDCFHVSLLCWACVTLSFFFFFLRYRDNLFCKSSVSARSFQAPILKNAKSRVQSPRRLVSFFVDFPVSGVVRAKPQKVELCCNVKLLDDMPPRLSQWNFLVRVLVGNSRSMWEKMFLNFLFSSDNACSI